MLSSHLCFNTPIDPFIFLILTINRLVLVNKLTDFLVMTAWIFTFAARKTEPVNRVL